MKKKMHWSIKDLSQIAILCALYVVLTYALAPLAYGSVQFRLSEMLVLLCFYNRKYSISMILGCLLANLLSPMGIWDIIFGTLATIFAVVGVCFSKKLWVAALWPTLFNALIVGGELSIIYHMPFFLAAAQVAIGEFVSVSLFGCSVWKSVEKNASAMRLIDAKKVDISSRGLTLLECGYVLILSMICILFFLCSFYGEISGWDMLVDTWYYTFVFVLPILFFPILLTKKKWAMVFLSIGILGLDIFFFLHVFLLQAEVHLGTLISFTVIYAILASLPMIKFFLVRKEEEKGNPLLQ